MEKGTEPIAGPGLRAPVGLDERVADALDTLCEISDNLAQADVPLREVGESLSEVWLILVAYVHTRD